MNPLTPFALIVTMIFAPFHYAAEYPFIAAGLVVWATAVIIGIHRWRNRLRAERKLAKQASKRDAKKELIKEAIAEATPRRFRNF